MKSSRASLSRALDKPDPAIRLYLFYGPDEGQSRGHAERLLKGLEAEKFVVSAQAAKSDPALIADEAGAIGLFGGKRALWIDPGGDEIAAAAEALLQAPAAESPAIVVAGALRKSSALVKLVEGNDRAFAHISYELNERDSVELVEAMARAEGLRLGDGIAARIAAAAGNERGIISQELAKIALFAGALPETPAQVDREMLDSIGAGAEGDWTRLNDLALSGDLAGLSSELDSGSDGIEPISVLRALQRRILMLAPIRSKVERGQRLHDAVTSAGKAVFWKEKDLVARMVGTWDSASLARILDRSSTLERRLMRPDSPPPLEALEEELLAIARTASRR